MFKKRLYIIKDEKPLYRLKRQKGQFIYGRYPARPAYTTVKFYTKGQAKKAEVFLEKHPCSNVQKNYV